MTTAIPPFILERTFNAPRSRIWTAWTDPRQLEQWWGCPGWEHHVLHAEVCAGGMTHYQIRTDAGKTLYGKLAYQEVEPLAQLVFIISFSDHDANVTRHPFAPEWPAEMLTTITLTSQNGHTVLRLAWQPAESSTAAEWEIFDRKRVDMKRDWNTSLDQLTSYLSQN